MTIRPRLTYATATVLHCLARGYRYGFDIMDASGLPDGTVYPILRRLEGAGYLDATWEDMATARQDGRPPRRYYRLTTAGETELAAARERFPGLSAAHPPPADSPPATPSPVHEPREASS